MKQPLLAFFLICSPFLFCNAQTWYQASDPYGGNAISLHETVAGDLLCGTGRGLYKSTDNGESWQSISGGLQHLGVLDAKSTPSGTYIALFATNPRRSYDGGDSWEDLTPGDWTSVGEMVVNSAGQIFLNTNNSVWRSSDDGDNWAQLTDDGNGLSLSSFDISPDGELFAGSYDSKIYRSDDDGDGWVELFEPANDIQSFTFVGENVIYASTSFSGIYRSDDNGENWDLLSPLPGTNGAYSIEANGSGDVFASAYDGGVFRTSDEGMNWEDITSDIVETNINFLFVNSGDELFAGTRSTALQKWEAESWTRKSEGITAVEILRLITIDGLIYMCTDSGVFISVDGGTTWQQSVQGMDDSEILALAKAPNGDLYAGGEMLYRSEDGFNWQNLSGAFPDGEVYAVDVLTTSEGRVVVASEDYGIRFTDDQGDSWTYANDGLDDVTMNFIRQNAAGEYFTCDAENLYRSSDITMGWETINNGLTDTDITEFSSGNGAFFAITYSDGLFKSTDNGDSWVLVNEQDFNNVTTNGNEVYGASESLLSGGVYFSEDNGENWANIGDGLPNVQVEHVAYVEGLGLFAYVRDFGLYTLDFSVLGLNDAAAGSSQFTCFPNPFSKEAILRIELKESSEISTTVFNLHGQLMDRSSAVTLNSGTHDIQVGSELRPGIYVLRITVGESTKSIRLVKTH